jgi:prophage regulatory protein
MSPKVKDDRLLRLPEVKTKTGLSRTTIYRRVVARTFPRPVSMGNNMIAWRESEINEWIAGLSYAEHIQ